MTPLPFLKSLPESAQTTLIITAGILGLVFAVGLVVILFLTGRALWRKVATTGNATGRRARMRDTAAPIVLAVAILLLAFDGLKEFAEDQMGIPVYLSWFVIVAFEFSALWFAWVRFSRAEQDHGESPFAAVMTWAVICLTAGFQYSHAVTIELDTAGTVGRTVLPLILGAVVEFSLHIRRTNVRREENSNRGRMLDSALKLNPVEYVAVSRALAAHSEWTAEQAVTSVRTRRAGRILDQLRRVLESPEHSITEIPEGTEESKSEYRQRIRNNARARAANTRRETDIERLRQMAIRRLEHLGFSGDPTGDRAADLLRDMQVRTRTAEVARLDYRTPSAALGMLGTLITPEMTRAEVTTAAEITPGPGDLTPEPEPAEASEESAPVPHPEPHPAPAPAEVPAPRAEDHPTESAPVPTDDASDTAPFTLTYAQVEPLVTISGDFDSVPLGHPEETEDGTETGTAWERIISALGTETNTPEDTSPELVTEITGAVIPTPGDDLAAAGFRAPRGTQDQSTETSSSDPDDDPDDDGPRPGGGGGLGPVKPPRGAKKGAILRLLTESNGHVPTVLEKAAEPEFRNTYGNLHKATVHKYRKADWMPALLRDLVAEFGTAEQVIAEMENRGISYDPDAVKPTLNEIAESRANVRPLRSAEK